MQIVHIIPGDLWAGAESQVFYLLGQLVKKPDHYVSVIIFNRGELYNRLAELGVRLYLIDEHTKSSFTIINRIREILIKDKSKVLHVHEYKSHVLTSIAKLMSGIDCVIIRTLHGKTALPVSIKMIKSFIVFQVEHFFLKYYTQGIIAVSSDIQQTLETKYRKDRIFNIPNAVSITPALDVSEDAVRSAYNIDIKSFWVGTAARLVEVKNIDMLLDVAKILNRSSNARFRVSIFGDGPLRDHLQNRIEIEQLNDVVVLHGHCEDILTVFQCLDVFVLTSYHEGLPMSLLEAMTLGTVPVCTRVGGMTEVINNNENGLLVDSDNAGQMADSILKLNNDNELKTRLSANAMTSMLQKYSIDRTVEDLLKLYEFVL